MTNLTGEDIPFEGAQFTDVTMSLSTLFRKWIQEEKYSLGIRLGGGCQETWWIRKYL